MMVWSLRDFIDAEERLEAAYNDLHHFSMPFIDRSGLELAGYNQFA